MSAQGPAGPRRADRRSVTRTLGTPLAAAMLYGSWAMVANRGHGPGAAVRAGLVQAALSFASTLSMVLLLEALFRLGRTPERGFLLSTAVTCSLMIATMAGVHAAAGTANVLATIAPSVTIGSVFLVVYAWRLLVLARRSAGVERDAAP